MGKNAELAVFRKIKKSWFSYKTTFLYASFYFLNIIITGWSAAVISIHSFASKMVSKTFASNQKLIVLVLVLYGKLILLSLLN